ncbi:MAG: hypothetical protein V3V13_02465 [Paracoccaceae bacterium]
MKRLFIIAMMTGLMATPMLGGETYPDVPKASGNPHPEGSTYWRINHPDLLKHGRDMTVHEGARNTTASLSDCITCHAVNGPDAKPVTIVSDQHFCRTCHEYAAVKIDCFQCHASVPEEQGQAHLMFKEPTTDGLDVLLSYLQRVSP